MSLLDRDKAGHDDLKKTWYEAKGIKILNTEGGVSGRGLFIRGTMGGIPAECGWALLAALIFLFCIATVQELGNPGCPLLVTPGNDHNTAASNLKPQRTRRSSPQDNPGWQHHSVRRHDWAS